MEQIVRISDLYMPMLERLSDDDKITIIERLLSSMKRDKSPSKQSRPDISTLFSGEWENDVPADKLADQYRANRYYDPDKKIEW